ncbi:chaplin family protein [Nocardiopsis sp. ATB16-24]|uniref:chaplin family protein n=1 Tax=Nocardiopsis sp. ATB16-24 TaxID=3019555 RepID=UPI002552B928|nr:chaplin family protein [Nocardiopsis sp. ATB16-24]
MTYDTHARIAALVTAGLLATSGGVAYADTVTSGNGSIGGGNQIVADLDVPINVCGNAIALLGVAGANCVDGDAVAGDRDGDIATSGNGSLLGGNQLVVDGDVPVNVCGNSVGVVGVAGANCVDGDAVVEDGPDDDPTEEPKKPEEPNPEKPEKPEKPKNPGEDEPESEYPGDGDEPGDGDDRDPQVSALPVTDAEAPSAPSGELALTGTDGGALAGWLAAAVAAVAAGVGLVLFGRRRRARA